MKIIIIGGVAAGMSAAAKAKRTKKDSEVVVYEKSKYPSFGACGLPYFIGDFVKDSNVLIARKIEELTKSGIDVKVGCEVISVDMQAKTLRVKNLENGEVFTDSYDRLMIATGASPIIPPFENNTLANIHTVKEFDDGIVIKEKLMDSNIKDVVIIGAGFIGIEMAEAVKKHGKNVNIIQLDDRILQEAFDKEITEILQKEILEHDINLQLGEKVLSFSGNEAVKEVITDKGKYKADLVIISTGVKPNTDFLKSTDIEMLANGAIVVDNQGRTNIEDVFAAGDCASIYHLVLKENVYIPLATTANKLGRVVGDNLASVNTELEGTLGSVAVKIMNMEAGRTGITEAEAIKRGIYYKTVFITDKNHANAYPNQEDIFVKLIYCSENGKILGGQIAGKDGAVLRVNVLSTAIYAGMTVRQLGMLDLCYAPPFARTWDVLNVAGNVAK